MTVAAKKTHVLNLFKQNLQHAHKDLKVNSCAYGTQNVVEYFDNMHNNDWPEAKIA